MALISELNAAVAEATTYPLPTVAMFSRVLREAGLLSKKGRGRGAAHATPVDGARLLIALLATPTPFAGGRMPQAIDCVADFGALVQGHKRTRPLAKNEIAVEGSGFTLNAAYGLPRRHTFEQALSAIIAGFAEERFASVYSAAAGDHGFIPDIEVAVLDAALGARVLLGPNDYHYEFEALVDCRPGAPLRKAFAELESVGSKYKRGIESRRMIGTEVLRKIAAVVNGRESESLPKPQRPS